jgi:hypothetical protein
MLPLLLLLLLLRALAGCRLGSAGAGLLLARGIRQPLLSGRQAAVGMDTQRARRQQARHNAHARASG